jgi:hypothetical protein
VNRVCRFCEYCCCLEPHPEKPLDGAQWCVSIACGYSVYEAQRCVSVMCECRVWNGRACVSIVYEAQRRVTTVTMTIVCICTVYAYHVCLRSHIVHTFT